MKPRITQIKTDTRGTLIEIIRVIFLNPRNPRLKHEYNIIRLIENRDD